MTLSPGAPSFAPLFHAKGGGSRRSTIDHHSELHAIFSIAYPRQYFYEYSAD